MEQNFTWDISVTQDFVDFQLLVLTDPTNFLAVPTVKKGLQTIEF